MAVLRAAPRRYRMPPLPQGVEEARAAGPEAALAFAIEAARIAQASVAERELFVHALATLLARAMQPTGGDAAVQALVLRDASPEVAESLVLAASASADRRRVRAAVDAIAHPGKLRALAPQLRAALAQLHALSVAQDWAGLAQAQRSADPALARLVRGAQLRTHPDVMRYHALMATQGPAAGSEAATRRGHAAARAGEAAEAQAVHALQALAHRMDAFAPGHRVFSGLRPLGGVLGVAPRGAKDEWDAALVRMDGDAADLVLLVESKASPVAASSDWPRLLQGLHRLSSVAGGADPLFAAQEGELRLRAASLRALAGHDDALPQQVLYCCSAAETHAPLLAPSARSQLLQQPACIAWARAHARGEAPSPQQLATVWEALPRASGFRAVLLQYETARLSREAMVHPEDVLATCTRDP
jgi:hypothetical protein